MEEFDNVDAYSSELPVSDWGSGEYTGPCTPEPEHYNGTVSPYPAAAAEAASAAYGEEPQLPESSPYGLQESPPQTG